MSGVLHTWWNHLGPSTLLPVALLLGQLPSEPAAFLGRCPMVLVSPASWGLSHPLSLCHTVPGLSSWAVLWNHGQILCDLIHFASFMPPKPFPCRWHWSLLLAWNKAWLPLTTSVEALLCPPGWPWWKYFPKWLCLRRESSQFRLSFFKWIWLFTRWILWWMGLCP